MVRRESRYTPNLPLHLNLLLFHIHFAQIALDVAAPANVGKSQPPRANIMVESIWIVTDPDIFTGTRLVDAGLVGCRWGAFNAGLVIVLNRDIFEILRLKTSRVD